MHCVLIIPVFRIYQGSEYVKIRQGFKYAQLCLNNSWISLITSIFLGSEYGFWIKGSIENIRNDSKYATGSEYGRVLNVTDFKCQGHLGLRIWLNHSWICLIMTKWLELWINGMLSILGFWMCQGCIRFCVNSLIEIYRFWIELSWILYLPLT